MSQELDIVADGSSAKRSPPRRKVLPKGVATTPTVDIVVNADVWQQLVDAEDVVRTAIAAAAAATATSTGEVAVVLTDDAAIRTLNREWRKKDAATNVLSFPTPPSHAPDAATLLGDIVIAYQTTVREAEAEQKPFRDHLAHLAVHGFLHLLGYDHESDEEAETMEGLETQILSRLGVPDPYELRADQS
jgi:probable rRNA maturation factor